MWLAGLLSFLVNLMAAAWIKFAPTRVAPSATTGILGAALLYLGATHSRWAQHIFQRQPEGHVSVEPSCQRLSRLRVLSQHTLQTAITCVLRQLSATAWCSKMLLRCGRTCLCASSWFTA